MAMERGRALLIQQAAQAGALGHKVDLSHRARPFGKTVRGWCTCGWVGTWRGSDAAALPAVFWHVGQVVGDGEAARVKPDTPNLEESAPADGARL